MAFRALNAVVIVLALWAAYLQLNDPDPLLWCTFYVAWAGVALLGVVQSSHAWLPVLLAVAALGWAGTLVPGLVGRWSVLDLTATMVQDRPEIELGREFGGLLIVATHSAAVAAVAARRSRRRVSARS